MHSSGTRTLKFSTLACVLVVVATGYSPAMACVCIYLRPSYSLTTMATHHQEIGTLHSCRRTPDLEGDNMAL